MRNQNERLANQGDVDELVRQVDRLCDAADWDGLVELRMRCRAALEAHGRGVREAQFTLHRLADMATALFVQAASADQAVQVRVVRQVAAPGMQRHQQSRGGTQVARVR